MITPLPLPDRPSCRLTWIEYRPFFMMSRGTTSIPAVSICCYAKAEYTASTRQVGCTILVDRIFWNPAMLYDTEMTAGSAFPELAHEMHGPPCAGRVLEQETSERLDRFRRRCAVFMDGRSSGK